MSNPIDQVQSSIRRIIRASDVHSNFIHRTAGLTAPQLTMLKAISNAGKPATMGQLAKAVSLSQATTTTILDRLEKGGYALRQRSQHDKRKVFVLLTEAGRVALQQAPQLIQEEFIEQFSRLEAVEQGAILSALNKVAEMMSKDEESQNKPQDEFPEDPPTNPASH